MNIQDRLNEINGIRIKLGMIPLKDYSNIPRINQEDEFEDENDLIDGEMGFIDLSPDSESEYILGNIHLLFDPEFIGIELFGDKSFRGIAIYRKDQIEFRFGKEN